MDQYNVEYREIEKELEGFHFILWSIGLPRALNQELSRPSRRKNFFFAARKGHSFKILGSASIQLYSAANRIVLTYLHNESHARQPMIPDASCRSLCDMLC